MKRIYIIMIGVIHSLISQAQLATNYINPQLNDYLFDVGSYWVYENGTPGVTDSIVVTDVTHGFEGEVWLHGYPYSGPSEYYKVSYESKTLNYTTWDNFNRDLIIREGGVLLHPLYGWVYNGEVIFLSDSSMRSSITGLGSSKAEIIDAYDNITINGHSFTNVFKILESSSFGVPTIYLLRQRHRNNKERTFLWRHY